MKLVTNLDPVLNCLKAPQEELEWAINQGPEGSNLVVQQANSYSTSGIAWNFNTQSANTVISRNIYAKVQFKLTFKGTAPIGQPLLANSRDSPRFLPLASVTNSLKVTINGSSVESQYSAALAGVLRYHVDHDTKEYDLSGSPSTQDNMQRYQDGVGGLRNPLANYQNSSSNGDTGRGAWQFDTLVNPLSPDAGVTELTATILFSVIEPLLISPLLYKSTEQEAGLLGVKNMGINMNFASGQLERVWSRSPSAGVTLNSVVCSIGAGATAPPQLHMQYFTPPLISQGQIPRSIKYQYYKSEVFNNDMNVSLAPNASQTFTNNAIQLSTIPKCIYIFATRTDNTKSYLTTDTFLRINSLSLSYLNVSGQFSSMPIESLYHNLALKNGCKMSWTEWSGKSTTIGDGTVDGLCGSVLKITSDDLHLPSNVASGMNINSQLSYQIGLEKVNQVDAIQVQITTVLVYDGY